MNHVKHFILICLGLCSVNGITQSKSYPFWGDYVITPLDKVTTPQWNTQDGIVKGWDWSLPPHVEPSPVGLTTAFRIFHKDEKTAERFINSLPKLNFRCNPVVSHWINWRILEEHENEFNFLLLKQTIQKLAEKGYSSIVRIHFSAIDFAPEWMSRYNIPIRKERNRSDGKINYEISHPDFHKRYIRFIEALGRTGIPYMKEVKGLYLGYASPSNGDEGIGPEGQNPDTVKHVRERIDAWASITKGVEYKVHMGGMCNYGLSKGFGIRRGFVEMYLYHIPDSEIGQLIDDDGYLVVNEENSIIENNLFNGEENEEYEQKWATEQRGFRFGKTTESYPYRYFTATLRLLQMRCNEVLLNTFTLNPDMFVWMALELGRTVKDAPDTWCFLRESYLKNKNRTVKNFERWLYQRDTPGYETEPVVRIDHPIKMWMVQQDKYFDYVARSGKKIGFNIDDNWPGLKGKVAIKISYIDNQKGNLDLIYSNGQKEVKKVQPMSGDGELKTVTFFLSDLKTGKMKNKFDFTVEAGKNTTKVIVSFVRIVRVEL